MTRMKPTLHIVDADGANRVLRDRDYRIPDILAYLDALGQASGRDFSVLAVVAQSSLVFQNDADHLQSRGIIARFFRDGILAEWDSVIDECIDDAIARLTNSPHPDIVHDLTDPLFVGLARRMFGVDVGDEKSFIAAVFDAREVTEPLLSLRKLDAIGAAFATIIGMIDIATGPVGDTRAPAPLNRVLAAQTDRLASHIDPAALLATLVVACHTMAETLAYVIWGSLQGGVEKWQALRDADYVSQMLEELLVRYGSTLNLFRVSSRDDRLQGCPVAHGQLIALDMPAIRKTVSPLDARTSLAFGSGPHRCPGAALSRQVIGRALPKIAGAFPWLRLKPDGAVFQKTRIIVAPVSLPCAGVAPSQRSSSRIWEIRSARIAEKIIADDRAFGPPSMIDHLQELSKASGQDFSIALRFARNALFFLSGDDHFRLRKQVTGILGPSRLAQWDDHIADTVTRNAQGLIGRTSCDLVADYCWPVFCQAVQPVLGLFPRDMDLFARKSPILQKLLKPLLSVREIRSLQDDLVMLANSVWRKGDGNSHHPQNAMPPGFLQLLENDMPAGMDDDDCIALTLILYGASFNTFYTLANALQMILQMPESERQGIAGDDWVSARMDTLLLPNAAAPKYIYRRVLSDQVIDGLAFRAGDTARLNLVDINAKLADRHLAFGHGMHHCVGAALSRRIIRAAIPALFAACPALHGILPVAQYDDNSQTVAPRALPCKCL